MKKPIKQKKKSISNELCNWKLEDWNKKKNQNWIEISNNHPNGKGDYKGKTQSSLKSKNSYN